MARFWVFGRVGMAAMLAVLGCGGVTTSGGAAGGGVADGGAASDSCALPKEAGPCRGLVRAWWHNPESGVCEPFIYGGCQGNDNRFASRDECQKACPPGGANKDACNTHTDCALVSASCCGCEPVGDDDLLSINAMWRTSYAQCTVTCGECLDPGELGRTSQYFVPTCNGGRCGVLDLRTSPYTSCAVDDDCMLRYGNGCCDGCSGDGQGILAVSRKQNFEQLVCGDIIPPCEPCPVPPPQKIVATCASGRCVVGALLP
jgi:Kunitz/Bovine pancreatic trypsin inhibitor domain